MTALILAVLLLAQHPHAAHRPRQHVPCPTLIDADRLDQSRHLHAPACGDLAMEGKVMTDYRCPYCHRGFADANARWQHAEMKHKGKKHDGKLPAALRPKGDDEQSYADLAIEAQMLRDSEQPVPEDLAWLLP